VYSKLKKTALTLGQLGSKERTSQRAKGGLRKSDYMTATRVETQRMYPILHASKPKETRLRLLNAEGLKRR